jgi:hypothetical protein
MFVDRMGMHKYDNTVELIQTSEASEECTELVKWSRLGLGCTYTDTIKRANVHK